jgi:hypothetical protein
MHSKLETASGGRGAPKEAPERETMETQKPAKPIDTGFFQDLSFESNREDTGKANWHPVNSG